MKETAINMSRRLSRVCHRREATQKTCSRFYFKRKFHLEDGVCSFCKIKSIIISKNKFPISAFGADNLI